MRRKHAARSSRFREGGEVARRDQGAANQGVPARTWKSKTTSSPQRAQRSQSFPRCLQLTEIGPRELRRSFGELIMPVTTLRLPPTYLIMSFPPLNIRLPSSLGTSTYARVRLTHTDHGTPANCQRALHIGTQNLQRHAAAPASQRLAKAIGRRRAHTTRPAPQAPGLHDRRYRDQRRLRPLEPRLGPFTAATAAPAQRADGSAHAVELPASAIPRRATAAAPSIDRTLGDLLTSQYTLHARSAHARAPRESSVGLPMSPRQRRGLTATSTGAWDALPGITTLKAAPGRRASQKAQQPSRTRRESRKKRNFVQTDSMPISSAYPHAVAEIHVRAAQRPVSMVTTSAGEASHAGIARSRPSAAPGDRRS